MDKLFQKLGCIILFLLFLPVFGQTPVDVRGITKEYDMPKLESLRIKLHNEFTADKEYALKFAAQHKIPVIIEENGEFSELMKILPDGTPVYYTTTNSDAAKSTRAIHLNSGGSLGLNLMGQNMKAYIWDQGVARVSHQEYNGAGGNNRYSIGDNSSTISKHAGHVTGTIIASGVKAQAKGMAPYAQAVGHDWNADQAEATAAAMNGMLISNHSYRSGGTYGGYILSSKNWDNIMHNAPYYLAVWAAGNDGNQSSLNSNPNDGMTGYDLIRGGGQTAKNSLTVANAKDAVVNSQGDLINVEISPTSSPGPMDEYRIKPEITGNGYSVHSTGIANNQDYYTTSGTSMAAPNVAGTLLLLQQHYNQLNNTFMRAATLKGLALHTADDAGPTGPDAKFGWGLLNAKRAAETITQDSESNLPYIQELTLSQGQTYEITVNADGLNKLMASISWTDLPGQPTSVQNDKTSRLVNDLDLRIIKGSQTYYPWKLTGITTNGKGDNNVDPYERVDVDGASGTYTIRVTHKGSLTGGSQNFSLIITGISNENIVPQLITKWNLTNTPVNLYTKGTANYVLEQNGVIKKLGSLIGGSTPNVISLPQGSQSGTYTMKIYNTSDFAFTGSLNNGASGVMPYQLTELSQWGGADLNSDLSYMFAYSNISITATDTPQFKSNTSLKGFFSNATLFNDDITNWDVSKVKNMAEMFNNAMSFNHSMGSWNIAGVTNMNNMFDNSGLDCENYRLTLYGWANQNVQSGVNLGADDLNYGTDAMPFRNQLFSKGWSITGDLYSTECDPEPAPCEVPTGVAVVHTADSATLTWDAGNGTEWKVRLNSEPWVSVTTNSHTFTDLTPGTLYIASVVNVCGDTESRIRGLVFTTDAAPEVCDKPNNLEVNLFSEENDSMTYKATWDAGESDLWYWSLESGNYSAEGTTSVPAILLTSLDFDTNYTLKVNAICSESESEAETLNFMTGSKTLILLANDDNFEIEQLGSVLYTTSVLDNDELNGMPLNANQVNIFSDNLPYGFSFVENAMIAIDETVLPGTYVFTYTVCLIEDENNCDTANVSVYISGQAIPECDISLTAEVENENDCVDPEDNYTVTLMINGISESNSTFIITDGYTVYLTNAVIGESYELELGAGEDFGLYAVGNQDYSCFTEIVDVISPVVCEIPEICDTPYDLIISSITETGARVSWQAGNSENWEVLLDGNVIASVTQPTYVLSGLNPNTTYTVGVRAICENQDNEVITKKFTTTDTPQEGVECNWIIRVWSASGAGTSWKLTNANGDIIVGAENQPTTFNDIHYITASGPMTFTLNTDVGGYRSVNYNIFREGAKIHSGTIRYENIQIDNLRCPGDDGGNDDDEDDGNDDDNDDGDDDDVYECDISLDATAMLNEECLEEGESYNTGLLISGGQDGDTFTITDSNGVILTNAAVAGTIFVTPKYYQAGEDYTFTATSNNYADCSGSDNVESPDICDNYVEDPCNWIIRVWSSNKGIGVNWTLKDGQGNIVLSGDNYPANFNDVQYVTAPGPLVFYLDTTGGSANFNVFRNNAKIHSGTIRNTVHIIDDLYCTDNSSKGSNDIDDSLAFDFNYYPNPVKDVLHIQSEKKVENVQVFNIGGFMTADIKSDIQNNEVDLTRLPAGMYIIKARLEGGQIETFKVWKK